MGVKSTIARMLGYKLAGGSTGIVEMQAPPQWNYTSYLQAYGQIGWLYATVNTIAKAVAKAQWRLYKLKKGGDEEEITEHPIIDLLNSINPFQTRYQFFYMHQIYKGLVGESFWQINYNKGGAPGEMWLAPPAYMSVVPSAKDYIDHYEFKRGQMSPEPFSIDEIIHIFRPNPMNPYRGISPAQALTTDLSSEQYATRYTEKFFHNSARPDFAIEYPADAFGDAEARKEREISFNEQYRGLRNVHKAFFLYGGKIVPFGATLSDLDLSALRKLDKETIIGAYGVPLSVMGITEGVTYANAQAGLYVFGEQIVAPELIDIREALNERLCPLFPDGETLRLDFDNPVPENRDADTREAVEAWNAGIINRNEARKLLNQEPIDGPEGDEYKQPSSNPFEGFGGGGAPKNYPRPNLKAALPEAELDGVWKRWVTQTETFERAAITSLKTMWRTQEANVIEALRVMTPPSAVLDRDSAIKQFGDAMRAHMEAALAHGQAQGRELVKPKPAHTDTVRHAPTGNGHNHKGSVAVLERPLALKAPSLAMTALQWLLTRLTWAAEQTTEETARNLAQALADGYAAGEGMDKIAARVKDVFEFADDVRALRVSRTEIMACSNHGALEGYLEAGIGRKEWLAARDERTRPSHAAANGQVVGINDNFRVGRGEGPTPGQIGQPEEDINCRCVVLPRGDW